MQGLALIGKALLLASITASVPLFAQIANQRRVYRSITPGSRVNLNFGTFIAGASGGTLTLDASNTRTPTGTVVPMPAAPASTPGSLIISLHGRLQNGYPNFNGHWVADYYLFIGTTQCATATAQANDPTYTGIPVTPPSSYTLPNLTLNRAGGGASMVVNFTPQMVSTPPGYFTTSLIGTSTDPVPSAPQVIVGKVNVAANQMPGTYTRTLTVRYSAGSNSRQTSITVTATVLAPLTLAKNADMDFGTLIVGGAGTVVLSPSGILTPSAVITPLAGTPAAAQFAANGAAGSSYAFSLPGSVVLSNGTGGSLTVDTFTTDKPQSGTFPATGSQPVLFNVGGTLHTTGTEPDGLYQASLTPGGSTFIANIAYN